MFTGRKNKKTKNKTCRRELEQNQKCSWDINIKFKKKKIFCCLTIMVWFWFNVRKLQIKGWNQMRHCWCRIHNLAPEMSSWSSDVLWSLSLPPGATRCRSKTANNPQSSVTFQCDEQRGRNIWQLNGSGRTSDWSRFCHHVYDLLVSRRKQS